MRNNSLALTKEVPMAALIAFQQLVEVSTIRRPRQSSTTLQATSASTFGLGVSKVIDQIEVLWPSGMRQVLIEVNADQILTIKEARQ